MLGARGWGCKVESAGLGNLGVSVHGVNKIHPFKKIDVRVQKRD